MFFVSSESKLKVSSNIPFERDTKLVGRIDIMKELEAKILTFTSHQRRAIVGLGGMG